MLSRRNVVVSVAVVAWLAVAGVLVLASMRGKAIKPTWVVTDVHGHLLYGWGVDGSSLVVTDPHGEALGQVTPTKKGLSVTGAWGTSAGAILGRDTRLTVKYARGAKQLFAGSCDRTFYLDGPDGRFIGRYLNGGLWIGDGPKNDIKARRISGGWSVTRGGKPVLLVHGPKLDAEVVILAYDGMPRLLRLAFLDARGAIPGTPAATRVKESPLPDYHATLRPFPAPPGKGFTDACGN